MLEILLPAGVPVKSERLQEAPWGGVGGGLA